MLVDSHCHLDQLDLSLFKGSRDEVIQRGKEHDVSYFLCVSISWEQIKEVMSWAMQYPEVGASVGVHPNERDGYDPSIEELIAVGQEDHVIAVGETGLDYYRVEGDKTWQQERFARHIAAAIALKKPLIIHTRSAQKDTIELLTSEKAREAGGVFHCFTEDWEMAQQALDLGFYISFSGILTFKNAIELKEVAKKVPLDRILIETDAPYLAPVPYRGKPNEPAYVQYVAQYLAFLRGISYEEVGHHTTKNFDNLFKK